MLFQSYAFIFGFLPAVVLGCHLLGRPGIDRRWRLWLLVVASVVFYGVLSPASLPFLALSCTVNFMLARRALAGAAVAFNVLLLLAFKYSAELGWAGGYFPLGASFITFIQIVYQIETLNAALRRLSLPEYLQVSTFFGFVTSGPVISPAEVVAQQDANADAATAAGSRPDGEHLLAGVALFALGLFKKLVIADPLAPHAAAVFDAAQAGQALTAGDAWTGGTLYMLQLYFDFSGYSDMAVAVGALVGLRLPLNFNSPFKATTVMDYWRRWHMTLTRFITHYLYLPLAVRATRWLGAREEARDKARGNKGGNEGENDGGAEAAATGQVPRFMLTVALPTIAAFTVAGVWHGNGWTFFLYGLYWGVVLTAYQAWSRYSPLRLPAPLAWALTMVCALVSLVIFRSPTVGAAGRILQSAVGLGAVPGAGHGATALLPAGLALVVLALIAALVLLPNSQQLLRGYRLSSDEVEPPPRLAGLAWTATPAGAVALGITLAAALLMGGGPTQFLYYKF